MDDYIAEIITEESTSFFSEDLLENESFANLNTLAQEMQEWLKKAQSMNKDFKSKRDIAKNLEKQQQEIIKSKTISEIKIKLLKKIKQLTETNLKDTKDALQMLQEGYFLIHSFREVLTGQEIKYKILFNRGKKGSQNLAEIQLSLDEIFSIANKVAKDKEKDFFLYINRTAVQAAAMKKIGTVKEIDEHQYKLFYGIQQVWENPPKVRGYEPLPKTINQGRVYEVYMKYKDQFGLALGKRDRSRVYWSLRKAVGEAVPGWLQGDYGNQQLKTVIDNSTATLMSFSQAEKIIKETLNVLENSKKDKTKITNLIKIYTTKGINRGALKNIDKDFRDEALEYINENFLKFLTK